MHHVIPPPAARCELTVCIPARNEAAYIERTLVALSEQRDVDGRRLPADCFDVLVFANNCGDDTAQRARAVAQRAPHVRIMTIEATLVAANAHIGAARKYVMDAAAARFAAVARPRGIMASLDCDTLVAPDWIAWIRREMHGRDAVAGRVTVDRAQEESLLAPVRLLYARELAYRQALADVEALIDPSPADPQPRHNSFVGASFAVTVEAYVAAGGIPALPRLEDVAFSRALRRIDARVRHSPRVRASTSGRLAARVRGGFGTFLAELHACAARGESYLVDHPQTSLDEMTVRAALRRIHTGTMHAPDIDDISSVLGLAAAEWLPLVDPTRPLGTIADQLFERAAASRRWYASTPVEDAIATLRATATMHRWGQPLTSSVSALETQDAS